MTDREWLNVALEVSGNSPHPRTKVGSVIVGEVGSQLVTGWNDFPFGLQATGILESDELRTMYLIHAEQMAIANCARLGGRTWDTTIYQTIMPCCECAKAIIQAGIAEVVVDGDLADAYKSERYEPQFAESLKMFERCGVKFRKVYR